MLSFSEGLSRSGSGKGKATFGDFEIVKVLDKASPQLLLDAASGQRIKSGMLELVRPDGQVFMDWKLTDLLVTGVEEKGGGSDQQVPMEHISLTFSKIEWDYTPFTEGRAGETVRAGWDVKTSKAFTPSIPTGLVLAASEGPSSFGSQAGLAAVASQSFVAYLKLEGLQGESQDAAHQGWIEVLSFSEGLSRSGSGKGKATFGDFEIVKVLDKASPQLLLDAASGQRIKSGMLELVRPDGQVFMDWKLTDLLVTGVEEKGGGSDQQVPMEHISLTFSKIEWDYTPFTEGRAGETVRAGWDVKTSKAFTPSIPTGSVLAASEGPSSSGSQEGLAAVASQSFVAYLKLEGLQGESQDAAHQGWIEVLSFSEGLSRSSSGKGKATFGDFQIVKVLDTASPKLLLDAASGQRIKSAVLELVGPDGNVFMDWKLTDLLVTGVKENGDVLPTEQISLTFSKIEWDYTPFTEGRAGETVRSGWDLKTSKAFTPSLPTGLVLAASEGPSSSGSQEGLAAAAAQSFLAYLKLEGLEGESQDVGHEGWIEVLSYSQGVSRSSSGKGKATFGDFEIVKVLDKSSPMLLLDAASGKHIPSGVLELVREDGQVFMDWKLTDLLVTGVQEGGSDTGIAEEQISLTFSKIEWDYTPFTEGRAGETVRSGWDLKKNRASAAAFWSMAMAQSDGAVPDTRARAALFSHATAGWLVPVPSLT